MKHYTIYKITNKLNGKIYIGKHVTEDLNDSYMGSGKLIREAIKKHGIENFEKEILHIFESEEEMNQKESEIITNKFIRRSDTYNLTKGGYGSWHHLKDTVTVKDKRGNTLRISIDDPRYLSGELVPIGCGKVVVKDREGHMFQVDKDDPRLKSGEFVSMHKNYVSVKDKEGNILRVLTNDPMYLSGELEFIHNEKFTAKDKEGNTLQIHKNDPRYLSGELTHIWAGRKHSEETKQKMRESQRGKQAGFKNSQFGKVWIHNLKEKRSTRVPKEQLDEWLAKGWIRGRKMKFI